MSSVSDGGASGRRPPSRRSRKEPTIPDYLLTLREADITTLQVDVVVNAANSTLLGGGGVDGAIHRAAGPELLAECRAIGGCPPGEARLTRGYRLPAVWVVHTVGPIWQGGSAGEPDVLAACYRSSIALAAEVGAQAIAFPSISTGVYRYPIPEAASVALGAVRESCIRHPEIREVTFACVDQANLKAYRALGLTLTTEIV